MSALEDLKGKERLSKLDLAVIYYGEDPIDEAEVRDAEKAAVELARLRRIESAARVVVNDETGSLKVMEKLAAALEAK